MGRLLERDVAAVVSGLQALVGVGGIVPTVVALAARHQWRQGDFRADGQSLSRVIELESGFFLDDDAGQLVTQRQRPGQRLRPVALQNVQVRAADATGADLDEGRLVGDRGTRHAANLGARTRAVEGRHPNSCRFHSHLGGKCKDEGNVAQTGKGINGKD